jgi:predicted nucleic acid-binding protein
VLVLDTNVISELLRPNPELAVQRWLADQHGAVVHLTAVTEAELRRGVAIMPAGRRRDRIADAVDAILNIDFRDRILPFDSAAAVAYAVISAQRQAIGLPISQFDAQIAAIARTHGAAVATRNVRDFESCGIEIIDPWTYGSPRR